MNRHFDWDKVRPLWQEVWHYCLHMGEIKLAQIEIFNRIGFLCQYWDNLELKLNRLQLDLEKEMHVISHTSPVDVSRAAPPTPRPAPSRPALSPPRRPTLSAKPPFQIMSPEKYPSLLLQKLDAEKRPELRHTDSSHGAHFLQSKQAVICTTSDDS